MSTQNLTSPRQSPSQRTPRRSTRASRARVLVGSVVAVTVLSGAVVGLRGALTEPASAQPDSATASRAESPDDSPATPGDITATDITATTDIQATGLDPELEARFAEATAAAAADGIALTLTSGWRTPEEQQELVEITLKRYGSADEAHRWVLPPETSAHVAGLAIDVGPTDGALWLGQHGAEFGLCRTYANEVWHFEPVIDRGGSCPAMELDSSGGWR